MDNLFNIMDNLSRGFVIILIFLTISTMVLIIFGTSHNSYDDACKDAGYLTYIYDFSACVDKEGKLHFGEIDDTFVNSFIYGYQFKFKEFKDE